MCLMPLSMIFQLYYDGQFYYVESREAWENYRSDASHWHFLSHKVLTSIIFTSPW